jgi:hypothetical protein
VYTGGAGSSVVSIGGSVVVGRIDDGVVVPEGREGWEDVVDREVVVGGRVMVAPPPPLPVARTMRP